MNEELQKALIELLDNIRSAKDFAIEQAPDVVQEMIMFHAITSWGGVLISVLLFVLAYWFVKISLDDDDMPNEGACAGATVLVVAGLFFLCFNATTAIMITFTPKYFIVKHLSEMIGG